MRKRIKPNRYGTDEPNYNDFFEELNKSDTVISNPTTKTTSTPSKDVIDNGKCDCVALLNLLLKKTDAIENHLIKLDVKINHLDSTPSYSRRLIKMGHIDLDQLRQFGLPLESKSELENLDDRLKNDLEFKKKLVSCCIILNYLRKIFESILS